MHKSGKKDLILASLASLKGRRFSFKSCPAIMKLAMEADGREHIEGPARHLILRKHEMTIKRLIDDLPLEKQVAEIERYLAVLPEEITRKIIRPMAGKEPKTDRFSGKD